MRSLIFSLTLLLSCWAAQAQQPTSKYDPTEAFAPDFYSFPGNRIRSASGQPGPDYWQNRADYKIEATLDTTNHSVTGKETLVYTNNSPDDLKFIWLQVDQNIYREDSRASATTTQEGGRWANPEFTQGQVLKSVEVEINGKKQAAKYTVTDTRMQVWLPQALKGGGGKMTLHVAFSFTVPERGTDRMGRLNSRNGWIYEIAQWYPRMCVYDDLRGWNVLPYLGQGEFYLEYGDIDFSITAPGDMLVVGSGELTNPAQCFSATEAKRYEAAKNSETTLAIRDADAVNAGIKAPQQNITWKFKIENTRDVAWAASKAFVLDGAKINLPEGKKSLALSAYPVESIDENGWQRSTEFVKASIEFYSKTYFPFPYPAATNVAGTVGGMEYPGIVFCSYRARGGSLWGVTDHEFGHTWFPMIVGSNERKFAWMDEGFNTFINDHSTDAFNNGEFKSQSYFNDRMTKAQFSDQMDRLFNAPDIIQQRNLGVAAYLKPSQMLHNLRDNVLGPERFDAAFKEYIQRWAFKHPSPWDFFRTMENVGGEDLGWFWRSWVLNKWRLDIAATAVKYQDNLPANGSIVTITNMEKMPMPTTVKVTETNDNVHTIKVPVEVWQRGYQYSFSIPTTSAVKEVVVDPDKKLPDWNRVNNTWNGN